MHNDTSANKHRLEEIRASLRAENISYGEIAELQGLVAYIDPSDVELLEVAGVPEQRDQTYTYSVIVRMDETDTHINITDTHGNEIAARSWSKHMDTANPIVSSQDEILHQGAAMIGTHVIGDVYRRLQNAHRSFGA